MGLDLAFLATVSIPERVWGGLEPPIAWLAKSAAWLFQSLRGFGVGWSGETIPVQETFNAFQSLRGFGVGWSAIMVSLSNAAILFQSLRGFGVGWSKTVALPQPRYVVSIPERVWGGLEQTQTTGALVPQPSFNP